MSRNHEDKLLDIARDYNSYLDNNYLDNKADNNAGIRIIEDTTTTTKALSDAEKYLAKVRAEARERVRQELLPQARSDARSALENLRVEDFQAPAEEKRATPAALGYPCRPASFIVGNKCGIEGGMNHPTRFYLVIAGDTAATSASKVLMTDDQPWQNASVPPTSASIAAVLHRFDSYEQTRVDGAAIVGRSSYSV